MGMASFANDIALSRLDTTRGPHLAKLFGKLFLFSQNHPDSLPISDPKPQASNTPGFLVCPDSGCFWHGRGRPLG